MGSCWNYSRDDMLAVNIFQVVCWCQSVLAVVSVWSLYHFRRHLFLSFFICKLLRSNNNIQRSSSTASSSLIDRRPTASTTQVNLCHQTNCYYTSPSLHIQPFPGAISISTTLAAWLLSGCLRKIDLHRHITNNIASNASRPSLLQLAAQRMNI